MSSERVERLIDHGIRQLHFARDHEAFWCIHCNKFLDWARRYEADEHNSLCPYQALAAQRKENERLQAGVPDQFWLDCLVHYAGLLDLAPAVILSTGTIEGNQLSLETQRAVLAALEEGEEQGDGNSD